MFDIDRWQEIWVTITRNKARSIMTCFGVYWGILMLVILLGSGSGLKNGVLGHFKGFATNSLFFSTDRTSESYKGYNKGREWDMRNRDVESIIEKVNGIEDISPILWGRRSEKNIIYGKLTGTFNVKGIMPGYFKIESQKLYHGRLLNYLDIEKKRKVCLIGTKVNEALFNNENPCGKYIRVNGFYYRVVGVIKARSSKADIGGRSEESVFLPFTTLQQTLNRGDILHILAVSVKQEYSVQRVIDNISNILKAQNEISPTDRQAINVVNIATQFATFESLFSGLDLLVWLVGIGTLLAGIIGVSNIMLVTIKERTKEIGIRRSLGAKPFTIISQIMSESLFLTLLSGSLGLCAGVYILGIVNKVMMSQSLSETTYFEDPSISIQAALASTVILIISGLFAGLIPAWRAMQIKAIYAIREDE